MPVEFELEINVQTSTRGGYRRFIENLRVRLGVRSSHNVPALAVQEEPPTRFFDLVIRTNDHSVRFRFRMDNLYLLGYQMENGQWLEFSNTEQVHLIREQQTSFLLFDSQYGHIARFSDMSLSETRVGFYNLGYGINQLATTQAWNTRAQYLIVVVFMFCEATRLRPVLDYTAANFDNSRGTASYDYNAGNRRLEGEIQGWMDDLAKAWGSFSTALLRADRDIIPHEDPDTPHEDRDRDPGPFRIRPNAVRLQPGDRQIRNLFDIIEIIGILLGVCFTGPPKPRERRMSPAFDEDEGKYCSLGLPLLQVFSVCIDNIDNEDPGDLYGTITVIDGLNTEYLYNRTRSNPESIRPGQNALLTGPSQSILAISNFTIKLLLTDKDTFRWGDDDEIVDKDISWAASEIGNVYDKLISETLDGKCGKVTVNYAVLRNAVAARITISLGKGGGELINNVYGNISARYGNWKDDPNTTCLLFDRSSKDYIDVWRWECIPLLRSVVAVPLDGSLILTASLYNHHSISFDDKIAMGTVEFPAQMSGTSSKKIKGDGDGNWVEVTVDWSCQI